MAQEASPATKSSMPAPHPVAALLTDEMRARIRAATFYVQRGAIRARGLCAYPGISDNGASCRGCLCPLAVALDLGVSPIAGEIANRLHASGAVAIVNDFIYLSDSGAFDPADVYALLGCDALSAARQPEAGTSGETP